MHSGMICHVICLKAAMAEGEFSMERRRLGSKPQGAKVKAEVSSSLLCLHCKCLLKMLEVKTAPVNHCLTPLFGKGHSVKEVSLMSFGPSKGIFLLWFQGADTLLPVLCRLAEQHKQGHVLSEFIILESREGREKCLYLCISLLCY